MDTAPLVTVVVTVRDRVQFLRAALCSILQQTFRSFEIIVTDDSNNPEIKAICGSLDRRKVRYRFNPAPLGVALNLRAAISEANGKYVAILNDDDSWEPDFLDLMVSPLESCAERVLAFGDHWIMKRDGQIDVRLTDENTARYRRNTLSEGELRNWEARAILDHTVPLAMAAVIRKDAIDWGLVVREVAGAYDFWITCLLASTGRPAFYIARRISRYRIHDAMETARRAADKNQNIVFIYRRLMELDLFPQLRFAIHRSYRDALFTCGKDNLFFNQLPRAREYFVTSFKSSPNPKALFGWLVTFLPRWLRTSCQAALARRNAGRKDSITIQDSK